MFFTAPEGMIVLARTGSVVPAIVTMGLAAVLPSSGHVRLPRRAGATGPACESSWWGSPDLSPPGRPRPRVVVVRHAGYPPRMMVFSVAAFPSGGPSGGARPRLAPAGPPRHLG